MIKEKEVIDYLRVNQPCSLDKILNELSDSKREDQIIKEIDLLVDKKVLKYERSISTESVDFLNLDICFDVNASDYTPEKNLEQNILSVIDTYNGCCSRTTLITNIKNSEHSNVIKNRLYVMIKKMVDENLLKETEDNNIKLENYTIL